MTHFKLWPALALEVGDPNYFPSSFNIENKKNILS